MYVSFNKQCGSTYSDICGTWSGETKCHTKRNIAFEKKNIDACENWMVDNQQHYLVLREDLDEDQMPVPEMERQENHNFAMKNRQFLFSKKRTYYGEKENDYSPVLVYC